MSEVLVIGHRNPDTDAICSAIGYAEFKRRTGMPRAVAARCGDTNDRIDFVLKTFGAPPPRFVADVAPKIRDVMQTSVVSVPPGATVAEALGIMDDKNIRALPILNEDRTCRGIVSVFKMSKFFFPAPNRVFDSRRVLASLRNLARTLNAKMIIASEPDREEDLVLMIGAMNVNSFAQRLPRYPREKLIVIVGDRQNIQMLAIDERVRVVVVTGGLPVEPEVIEAARRNEVSLLLSPHDSATTAMLCRTAITVGHMLHEHFLTFHEDEPLSAVQRLAAGSQFHAFPVLDDHKKVVGILSKSDFLRKVERQLILVDHNELSQAVHGAGQVEILEIIDHHRIGALTTHQPILFHNEPVGSTSSIVADCFFRHGVELTGQIAGLLLAGLVSDTLNLTSPTTTGRDVEILTRLERISGVNAGEFTEKLFASGSLLVSKPAAQAIATDCKEYAEQGRSFSVAQIEEIGFDAFWKRKRDVVAALEALRANKGYFFCALLVTDVVKQTSLLVIAGSEQFLQKVDYPELEPGIYELEGVVSRKKQLLPYLTHCLAGC
ncbi:MAG TPA: putative manganese-dependent inorganic diphosphatase [Candidatus Angelobacter sp.]|nr:putative manganese-dependent inorganic diphosphatase [Candidatus Angelobacter sp.]